MTESTQHAESVVRCPWHPEIIVYESWAWSGHFGGRYVPCIRCWSGGQFDGEVT